MQRSTDRILTTHVGSLIRPPELQDFLRAQQAGEAFDHEAYDACLDRPRSPTSCASRPKPASTWSATASSASHISWSQYVLERLSGFERRPVQAGRQPVPARRPTARGSPSSMPSSTRAKASRPRSDSVCVGPIAYTGQAALQRDIDNFKAALAKTKVTEAFLPVAAPASVIPDRKNEYYKTEEDLPARHRRGDAHRIQA